MGAQARIDLCRPDTRDTGADSLIVSHSFPPTVQAESPVTMTARAFGRNIVAGRLLFK